VQLSRNSDFMGAVSRRRGLLRGQLPFPLLRLRPEQGLLRGRRYQEQGDEGGGSMSEVILVKKCQCEVCGMLSARSPVTEAVMIRRDCPVCKEATTHHAVVVNQAHADINANIERQFKEQA